MRIVGGYYDIIFRRNITSRQQRPVFFGDVIKSLSSSTEAMGRFSRSQQILDNPVVNKPALFLAETKKIGTAGAYRGRLL